IIGADSQNGDPPGLKQGIMVAEVAGFFGASGGIVFGIEEQDQLPTSVIFQGMGIPILVQSAESGGFVPGLNHSGYGAHLLNRYFIRRELPEPSMASTISS